MKRKISILGYGCSSAAGSGVAEYWQALTEGRDLSAAVDATGWPGPSDGEVVACRFPGPAASFRTRLVDNLLLALRDSAHSASHKSLGVIFASAKGCLEDFVWEGGAAAQRDPLTPCLESFLERAGLEPRRALCVSNACASSHSALFLAAHWLETGLVSHVLVAAADGFGPFVHRGFRSLGALSPTRSRPFSGARDGLRLGEAAAVAWLSSEGDDATLELKGVGIDAEGFAVTRPSDTGESLKRAIRGAGQGPGAAPGLILAHGTGTAANDAVEDRVFCDLFRRDLEGIRTPPVTATKWSIGHTLGASGLMDFIAAAECLRQRRAFRLAATPVIDERFGATYLHAGASDVPRLPDLREVLVTSLGFGGVHAAVRVGAPA